MTLSHDEANARLLELVYDEATPAERAALEAHVATCAECQAELASLGATRAHVRAALDDAPVPPRAHARILEAAAQAVAAPAPSPMAAAPARVIVPARAPSLWERLRGRWTFPTLATVGAVAVVLLASKVFLDPQRTIERGREAMAPTAPVTRLDEGLARNAASSDDRGATAERARAMASNGASPALGGLMGKRMSEALLRKHRESANAQHGVSSREGAGEISSGGFGAGAPSSLGLRGGQAPPPTAAEFARPPSDWKGGAPGNGPSARTSPPPMAAPPSPAPTLRAAPVASSAPRRMQKLSDDSLDGLGAGSSAAAEARAEPAPARPSAAKKSARADRDEETGADSPAADKAIAAEQDESERAAPAKERAAGSKHEEMAEAPTQETLARRAEQLFAARRWSAAIAVYRDLIRRFPDADLKPRWSARITQAQAESDADLAQRSAAAAKPAAEPKVRAKAKADAVPVGE